MAESQTLEEPQQAAKEPASAASEDDNLVEIREAAKEAEKRVIARDERNTERLERRYATRDPEAVAATQDVRKSEAERREAQEKAADEAQERASQWIAPNEVKGRLKKVSLILHPEPKARKHTIQIRVLGEVPDGYVMVFEDPFDENDLKQGRVAESPRFGTKNKVRVEVDPVTGEETGPVHTHPGYFDFGPLRMHPGDYRAVVVNTSDDVLAEETFKIVPDTNEDGLSDQVPDQSVTRRRRGSVMTAAEAESKRAAAQEQQFARQQAKAAGEKDPGAPKPVGPASRPTAEEKRARKNSPEGQAK